MRREAAETWLELKRKGEEVSEHFLSSMRLT
jgi:hypothetical protein